MSTAEQELKVVEAVGVAEQEENDLIHLTSGVILRGKKAKPTTLMRVMSQFPRPKPPMWKNPQFGRMMENVDDPEYQEQLKAWEVEQSTATLNAMILLGTELVKTPKGMSGPEDDAWLEDYELLGIPMNPGNSKWRYLSWVMFVAIEDEEKDLKAIQEVVGRLSGVRDSTVQTAEQFPGSD